MSGVIDWQKRLLGCNRCAVWSIEWCATRRASAYGPFGKGRALAHNFDDRIG
jgi:hypothetical protein